MEEKTIEQLREEVKRKRLEVGEVSERYKLEKEIKRLDFQKRHHATLKRTQSIEDTVNGTIKGILNVFGKGVEKLNKMDEDSKKKESNKNKSSKSFEEELNEGMNSIK